MWLKAKPAAAARVTRSGVEALVEPKKPWSSLDQPFSSQSPTAIAGATSGGAGGDGVREGGGVVVVVVDVVVVVVVVVVVFVIELLGC